MTFENKTLSEQKSETRGGLIYLNNKESQQDSNEIDSSSPRQFYNQTRKTPQNNKSNSSNQPQSVTQSSRGLTNVKRTLYDPNAPTPKTPPISQIQPITTVKIASNLPPPPPPSLLSTNTQPQMQEFHQQ